MTNFRRQNLILLLFSYQYCFFIMKVKHFIIGMGLIFLSCEGETIDPDSGDRPLSLRATIEETQTGATDNLWENGDAIGIYMVKSGTSLDESALKNNAKYVTSGTSQFEPAREEDEIVFPIDGSSVDFIGYFPYNDSITNNTYPVDVSSQGNLSAIDLMYSDNAKNNHSQNTDVDMTFSHQLSKIVLNISHPGTSDLSNLSVTVTGAATKADFDLATGTLSNLREPSNISMRVDNDGKIAEAILLPTEDLSDIELWFVLDEEGAEVYKYPLGETPSVAKFEKTTKYTYNVTLSSEKTVAITKGSITEWTENPAVDVVADKTNETLPVIKGTEMNPLTVMEAISQQGQSDVWIKGYIVGSFNNNINGFNSSATNASSFNIALADDKNETETSKMIPVHLPSTCPIRDTLSLVNQPSNLGKAVKIKGSLEEYINVPGLKSVKDCRFIDTSE